MFWQTYQSLWPSFHPRCELGNSESADSTTMAYDYFKTLLRAKQEIKALCHDTLFPTFFQQKKVARATLLTYHCSCPLEQEASATC